MFPLAFVAGSLQGHWWGFICRNYVVWPIFFLLNVFIALKGNHFWILFFFTSEDTKRYKLWSCQNVCEALIYLLDNIYPYFEGMVNRIYPPELQLNKANTSDTEAPFLDLHLSISNGFVSSKIYDKRDDFDFDIVIFLFWMVTFPVLPLTGFTFLNLFDLLECLVMWLNQMPVIKV